MCVCQFVNININIYIYRISVKTSTQQRRSNKSRRSEASAVWAIMFKHQVETECGSGNPRRVVYLFFLWCLAWYLLGIFHKNVLKAACSIFSYGHIRRGTPRFQTHMYDLELLSLNCWCSWWNSDEFLLLRLKTFQRGGTVWKSSISIPFGYLT